MVSPRVEGATGKALCDFSKGRPGFLQEVWFLIGSKEEHLGRQHLRPASQGSSLNILEISA